MLHSYSRTAKNACSCGHPSEWHSVLTSTWTTAILTELSVVFLSSLWANSSIFSLLVHDRSLVHPPRYNIYHRLAPTDGTVLMLVTVKTSMPDPVHCAPCTQTLPAWTQGTVLYAFMVTIHLLNLSRVLQFQLAFIQPAGVFKV